MGQAAATYVGDCFDAIKPNVVIWHLLEGVKSRERGTGIESNSYTARFFTVCPLRLRTEAKLDCWSHAQCPRF